jgi:hypothetical protein
MRIENRAQVENERRDHQKKLLEDAVKASKIKAKKKQRAESLKIDHVNTYQ